MPKPWPLTPVATKNPGTPSTAEMTGLPSGVTSFMPPAPRPVKPFNPAQLAGTVQEALEARLAAES